MSDYASRKTEYIWYDGTNAQSVIDRYPPDTVLSSSVAPDGTITMVEIYNTTLVIPPMRYIFGTGQISNDIIVTAGQFVTDWAQVVAATPAPVYTLHSVVGTAALPAITLLSPNFTAVVNWDRLPGTTLTPADVRWRAVAGASVLSSIQLQAIASPVVVDAPTGPRPNGGCTIHLRAVGLATVAGVLLVEAQKLTHT